MEAHSSLPRAPWLLAPPPPQVERPWGAQYTSGSSLLVKAGGRCRPVKNDD